MTEVPVPLFHLDGKTALVTGAATGLGAQIAVTLARQGASVIISDKPGKDLANTGERQGRSPSPFSKWSWMCASADRFAGRRKPQSGSLAEQTSW